MSARFVIGIALLVSLAAGLVALWFGNVLLLIVWVLLAIVFGSVLETLG